jgi:multiple sugar transport system permease protein
LLTFIKWRSSVPSWPSTDAQVPRLIAAGVLAFVFSWNEFSIALNLVSQANVTVPVVVAKFAQDYEIQHGQMAAASILATIPALVLTSSCKG